MAKRNFILMLAATLAASVILFAAAGFAQQHQSTTVRATAVDRKTVATFVSRAKAYSKLRSRVASKLPKLSKDSTPEQIAAHKKAFEEAVRKARVSAKPNDIFTAATQEYLRRMIKNEFKGQDRGDVKEAIMDAETAGVPLRVNFPYPESKEVSAVPPTLLLKLPLLPKELNYRFVGRHMLLIDKENGLILDFMLNALP